MRMHTGDLGFVVLSELKIYQLSKSFHFSKGPLMNRFIDDGERGWEWRPHMPRKI